MCKISNKLFHFLESEWRKLFERTKFGKFVDKLTRTVFEADCKKLKSAFLFYYFIWCINWLLHPGGVDSYRVHYPLQWNPQMKHKCTLLTLSHCLFITSSASSRSSFLPANNAPSWWEDWQIYTIFFSLTIIQNWLKLNVCIKVVC